MERSILCMNRNAITWAHNDGNIIKSLNMWVDYQAMRHAWRTGVIMSNIEFDSLIEGKPSQSYNSVVSSVYNYQSKTSYFHRVYSAPPLACF